MLYRKTVGYPVITRTGLGNELFAWARCVIWCKDNELPMIAPTWHHIHIGPYLRGEVDKRQYHLLFNNCGYISGAEKLLRFAISSKVPENSFSVEDHIQRNCHCIVCFKGMHGYFVNLKGRSKEVREELERITVLKYLPSSNSNAGVLSGDFIGVHVRLGDFAKPADQTVLITGKYNFRIDLDWYIEAIKYLRQVFGYDAKVVVISDGKEQELEPILNISNTALFRGGASITDMLALSQARVLVASGSSFSMWASYLGQVPTIWYPGQRRQSILDASQSNDLEPEWICGKELSEYFKHFIRKNQANNVEDLTS